MTPVETKLLWLAIGIGTGYLIWGGMVLHHHHYRGASSSNVTAPIAGESLAGSPNSGGLPPSCGCGS